jgi:hypothetical protein
MTNLLRLLPPSRVSQSCVGIAVERIRCHEGTSLNLLKTEIQLILNINSVRTSQETHYVSATKPNRLMLFRETVAVYCENHTEHTDKQGFSYVKAGRTYSDQASEG